MKDKEIEKNENPEKVGYGGSEAERSGDAVSQIDGSKATRIARDYLEQNFGNVGMLYYRVENLTKNTDKTIFYVICSLLSAFGSSERLYYQFKVNVSDGSILEVWKSQPAKEGENEITLKKIKFKEE